MLSSLSLWYRFDRAKWRLIPPLFLALIAFRLIVEYPPHAYSNQAYATLATTPPTSFSTPLLRSNPNNSSPLAVTPQTAKQFPTIIIDPGHGGSDQGTTVNSITEKDVLLNLAIALRHQLEAARYNVYLTRNDDRTLTPSERIAITRRLKADLLISLHADASNNPAIGGIAVYTHDIPDPNQIAAIHNNDPISQLLLKLGNKNAQQQAQDFARQLITTLRIYAPLSLHPHRHIKTQPDLDTMPIVRLDIGDLNNPRDLNRLTSITQQQGLAVAIKNAIQAYFDNQTKRNTHRHHDNTQSLFNPA